MILVAGATGVLGSEIVRRLRARGENVRALVRTTSAPEKVELLQQLGAEIVRGDLREPQSLVAATAGVSGVISTVTIILTAQPGDSFEATDQEGTKSLIDAAKKSGAEKFIFISFDTSRAPDAPLVRAKKAVEEHLKNSGLDYTILHPTLFQEIWLGPMLFADPTAGTAKVYGKGNDRIGYVAVSDVAEVAVQSLTTPEARNATISFGGPDAFSQRDMVRMFEEAFGKKFNVIEIPEDALEAQWSAAENQFDKTFAALMLGVARGLGSGTEPPAERFSMQMTSPREFVRRMAHPIHDDLPTAGDRQPARTQRTIDTGTRESEMR